MSDSRLTRRELLKKAGIGAAAVGVVRRGGAVLVRGAA